MSTPSDPDSDLVLYRLSEELATARAAGESIDVRAWALRFGVTAAAVERALAAVEALGELGLPSASKAAEAAIPPTLPSDFELLEELGRGGMGVVWRARQRSLEREVAVKVLMPGELAFGAALERFRREAKSLARLRHRHIVAVHDVGEHDGHLYYVMDLVEGRNLAQLVAEEGALNPARAVRLLRQVASAIAYVHERGIVHRDLKPGNVLVDGAGDAYVVDFGLARDVAVDTSLTATGHLLGTPAYMAPEQARGDHQSVGETADVYAMGALLYECLAGRAPFHGKGLVDLVHAVVHDDPTPLARVAPATPEPLQWVVRKAMAKSPGDRYPTARAFLEDLERFEEGRSVLAVKPKAIAEFKRLLSREKTAAWSVVVTLVATVLFFWLAVLPVTSGAREVQRIADEQVRQGDLTRAGALYDTLLDERASELSGDGLAAGALARLDRALELRAPEDEPARRALLLGVQDAFREAASRDDLSPRGEDLLRTAQMLASALLEPTTRLSLVGDGALLRERLLRVGLDDGHSAREPLLETLWLSVLDGGPELGQNLALAGPDAARLIGAALPYGARSEDGRALTGRNWQQVLAPFGQLGLVEELLPLLESGSESGAVRDLALVLATALEELPAPRTERESEVFRSAAAELVAFFRTQLERTPEERLVARARLVADVLLPLDPSSGSFAGWFREQFDERVRGTRAAEFAAALDPSVLLQERLELDPDWRSGDPLALLDRFHYARGRERRLLHNALTLRAPTQRATPRWPIDMRNGPGQAWEAFWSPERDPDQFRVRWALLAFDGLGPEYRLADSGFARFDERGGCALATSVPLVDAWSPAAARHLMRIDGRSFGATPQHSVVVRLEGELQWITGGRAIAWQRPSGAFAGGQLSLNDPHAPRAVPGLLHSPFSLASRGKRALGVPVVEYHALAILEPNESGSEPWSAADWQSEFERQLAAELAAWLDEAGRTERLRAGEGINYGDALHLLGLAELLPAPAATDELNAFFQRGEAFAEKARVALMRAGVQSAARAEVPSGKRVFDVRLLPVRWARMALAAGPGPIAEVALAKLEPETRRTTQAFERALASALEKRGIERPAWLEFEPEVLIRFSSDPTTQTVLSVLVGFVVLSLLLGIFGALRSARRRGISWARITSAVSLVVLLSLLLLGNQTQLAPYVSARWRLVAFLLLALSALGVAARLRGWRHRLPGLVLGVATALYAWSSYGSGGELTLATAGCLLYAGVFALAAVFCALLASWEGYDRRMSIVIWAGALIFAGGPLFGAFSLLLVALPYEPLSVLGNALAQGYDELLFYRWLQEPGFLYVSIAYWQFTLLPLVIRAQNRIARPAAAA